MCGFRAMTRDRGVRDVGVTLPLVIPTATAAEDPAGLLGASAEDFGERTNPFRRELLVHCYRMLGSIDDAEDAVQEAFARAWRSRATFRESISVRAWLYRIATNVCLDAIERRRRTAGPSERPEVGPIPDDVLDAASDPEARYDAHESISLAFLTALQVLPPRQRAVLILRDVLAWRATEVAGLLELSVPAVNSALHRARATIATTDGATGTTSSRAQGAAVATGRLRDLLDRYVRAWEAADIPGLVALLRDDAIVSMPPGLTIRGRDAIAAFLANAVFVGGLRIRLRPVGANRAPAFAIYSGAPGEDALGAFAVLVLEADDAAVGRMSVFADPRVIERFGLAPTIAADPVRP
jgi:RNA polymerase sigma-70 factor (ECF subfamily)